MAFKLKQLTYQDAEQVIISEDRIVITYIDGQEVLGDHDLPTDLYSNIKVSEMSVGNPNNLDLSTVGSKELLDQLLLNLSNKLNS